MSPVIVRNDSILQFTAVPRGEAKRLNPLKSMTVVNNVISHNDRKHTISYGGLLRSSIYRT